MVTANAHWTERSVEDFVHRIAADFIVQIEKKMDEDNISQKALAAELDVSVGRVSQVLNNPGNLTLKNIVQYSRCLGMKVTIVAYEDADPLNQLGPINPKVFNLTWENAGRPRDMWALSGDLQIAQSGANWPYYGCFLGYAYSAVHSTWNVNSNTVSQEPFALTSNLEERGTAAHA